MDYPYQMDGFPNPFFSNKRSYSPTNDIEFEKLKKNKNKKLKTCQLKKNLKKIRIYSNFDNRDNLAYNKKIKITN